MSRDRKTGNEREWPDLAGRMEGGKHILPIRVYFEDTDFSGLVYHGSYLRWCERGRSDRLRLMGVSHAGLFSGEAGGGRPLAFVVRRIEMDFRRPARIDEILQVITSNREWGGASITLDQRIEREGELLMKAIVQVVLIDDRGRPQRLPAHLRKTFLLE
jgi:acyl-CoA thioester hydrolase